MVLLSALMALACSPGTAAPIAEVAKMAKAVAEMMFLRYMLKMVVK